ncbi:MAG: hypothetical protein ACLQVI_16820, partial [Polyangiaceae bacterium]
MAPGLCEAGATLAVVAGVEAPLSVCVCCAGVACTTTTAGWPAGEAPAGVLVAGAAGAVGT